MADIASFAIGFVIGAMINVFLSLLHSSCKARKQRKLDEWMNKL